MTGSVTRAAVALLMMGGVALLPTMAGAQGMVDMTGSLATMPSYGATDPGSALAPRATPLTAAPVGDRTPAGFMPQTAAADRSITLQPDAATAMQDDAATVLADRIQLEGDRTLIAAGGVVVWYQGARLVASRIVVDGPSGVLTIEGPIHLSNPGATDPDTQSVLVADSAQLDRELQDGIIRGARMVLARELQLASRDAQRSQQGRVTTLRQVVASSCQVCAGDPTPLWEIRARSITHDARTRLLRLDHPQLRAFGLPVGYLPFAITAPDPTVERKSGFLRPQFRTTSGLGFGMKLPYFQTLGDSADVTLTPYLSANRTTTLELRYRQAYRRGAMEWNGAISRDDIDPGNTRGYLFGNATYALPRGYDLGVQVQLASDRGYLLDYDVTDADRLWSGVTLERVSRDRAMFARIGNYRSLRDDEDNDTSPALAADAIWLRRIRPPVIGGEALMEWWVHAHRRPSDEDMIGRDVASASLGLDWRRSTILPGGVVGAALVTVDSDLYRIAQDSSFDDIETRVVPTAGVELRWPVIGQFAGATTLIEPVAQLLYSRRRDDRDTIPNEDSRLVEFDEGNLFAIDRFPGNDARESGLRANVGASWTRLDPLGWSLGVTGGRVFRADPEPQFGIDSPLRGSRSDWLLAAHFDSGTGLALVNRALFDDNIDFTRNELRVGWLRPDLQLSAGHLWINGDAEQNRRFDINEVSANLGWQITDGWWGVADVRHDFAAHQTRRASLDLTYRNECIAVGMGVERRFDDSSDDNRIVRAETSFDLSVRLGGFGMQNDGPGTVARRNCMR